MIKLKVTQRDLKDSICYSFGYCDIQGLVSWKTANAYNFGLYGKNYDAYFHETLNIVITTGYRPYGKSLHDDIYIPEKHKSLTGLLSDYAFKIRDNKEIAKLLELLFQWCLYDYNVYHAKWLKDEIKAEKNSNGYYHKAMADYKRKLSAIIRKVKKIVNV